LETDDESPVLFYPALGVGGMLTIAKHEEGSFSHFERNNSCPRGENEHTDSIVDRGVFGKPNPNSY
jgi:hypothetical protein